MQAPFINPNHTTGRLACMAIWSYISPHHHPTCGAPPHNLWCILAPRTQGTPEQRQLVQHILKAKDFYAILSIEKAANDDDIKKAYRKVGCGEGEGRGVGRGLGDNVSGWDGEGGGVPTRPKHVHAVQLYK